MPGIVGLITRKPREEAERQLLQMLAAVRHEAFYESGTWMDESLGVYVGWVAQAGSFADAMPLISERGDLVLAFSGEEYSGHGTGRRRAPGAPRTSSDVPSYLIRLCEQDASFPSSLNGRFHGLVADLPRRTATLFNDRYGMHRLYFSESVDTFYFAAEAKAILVVRPELRRMDPKSLGEFVACGCVLENRTLFDGIQLLPAGAKWIFREGSLAERQTYFDPQQWEAQPPLDVESYYRAIREVLAGSLPRYFNGDQPIGVALTGGLDTRVLMASRHRAGQRLRCYTFGSMFRENEDVRIARQVAQACGQPYQVIATGHDFLSRFAHYAERSVYLTDGCVDLTRSPDLYVSERAREIAPVKVVGTYGSEVFSLVPTFKPKTPVEGLFSPEFSVFIRQAETTYARLRGEHPLTFTAFRQSPWCHFGVLALEQTQLTVRSPFLDNEFIRTMYQAPPGGDDSSRDVRRRLVADESPQLARIRTDRGVGGSANRVVASLSRALLEFSYKSEYAYDYGMPQRLAQVDHLLSPLHLERLFLGRHKMFHFRVWYRDALASYVREMLLDRRSLARPYVERRSVEAIVNGHVKGNRNYTTEIHKLLTLEILHRQFVDVN